MIVLAGDVGGTKSDLGLFSIPAGSTRPSPLRHRRYPSAGHGGLEEICRDFLAAEPARPDAAAFGVAGPVVDGAVRATNLSWVIEGDALSALLGCPVALLNDLESTAHGIAALRGEEVHTLSEGREVAGGARAIVAAGTGLGEGYMVFDAAHGHYVPAASEGGHCDFAPRGAQQIELLEWLSGRHDHVSVERVVSGMGIEDLFAFLAATGRHEVPPSFDPRPKAAQISAAALAGEPRICVEAMRLFVDCYGAEAGNLALKVMALGGLYVGGGIAPRILPLMTAGGFMEAFLDKGRFAPLMARIPVRLILNDQASLLGAALAASYLGG